MRVIVGKRLKINLQQKYQRKICGENIKNVREIKINKRNIKIEIYDLWDKIKKLCSSK